LLQIRFAGAHVAQADIRVFRVDRHHLVDAVHELGDAKQTERKRDQFDSVVEMRHSKCEAFCTGLQVGADDTEHQPEHRHCHALER
jgi:hypothetical protein